MWNSNQPQETPREKFAHWINEKQTESYNEAIFLLLILLG